MITLTSLLNVSHYSTELARLANEHADEMLSSKYKDEDEKVKLLLSRSLQ